jgi:PAS domain S-box-containing protein
LPHYVTFYPAVMLTAILAGIGPGLLATGLAVVAAAYWILPPHDAFLPMSPNDAVGLGIFSCMGVFMTVVAELYHRSRHRAAVYEKELAVREEQARAAVETERQRQLLAVTLASIGDGVIVTDAHGRVTFLNAEAEQLTGWASVEASGRPLVEIFPIVNEHTGQEVENPADKVLRLGATVGLANHTILIAKDGRRIPIDDSGAPVRSPDGNIHGVVLVFRDFTEKRQAEALLRARLRLSEMAQRASADQLIQTALDEAESLTDSSIGYFHLVDEDQQHLTLQCWSANTLRNMCQAEGKGLHYPISKAGVWMDCFHSRQPVIHNDYASLTHKKGLPKGHAPIIRDVGVPVLRGDRVVAIIGVGNKPTDYTESDVLVLQSLAVPLMDLVGYKRAEETLRESEQRRKVAEAVQVERQRFHDVLEVLPAYVVLLTPDHHVTFANRFFEERFGKSNGRRCYEYLFNCTEPCENCETFKVLTTHAPHHWEWIGPDGRTYDVHDFPFTDADGSSLILEMGMDITEIRQAQAALKEANDTLEQRVAERTAALRESEARYRSYIEVTLQVGWTTNADGEVVEDMPAWRQFTGQTLEEIQGWGWASALHPDDLERTSAVWRQVVANRQRYETEHRLRRHDGVYRHFLARSVPIVNEDGSVREWVGTCIDITERKQTEERIRLLSAVTSELLASDQPQRIVEALCRRVMDHVGCQVFFNFLVDEQQQCLRLNACAGVSEEVVRELDRLDYGTAVCGCVAKNGCRIVAEQIQTTPNPHTDLVRSLGVQAYACHPLLDQGRVIGTLSFGSRTRPTFTEDELSLMKAVADDVSIAMQRVRLVESLERHARAAEAASEAKGQFLANISHELRTPMNAILGMVDLALPKQTDPTAREFLQTARNSADLLLALLNDLLDSAKIESGKLELESAPFSLRHVVDQTTQVLAVRTSEKGISFSCHISPEVPDALVGDQVRLRQVLLNLAGNAIKFTERGGVAVRVRAQSQDAEAGCLEFAVEDTGIGIPRSDLEHIFEPFTQVDPSNTRRFGGTGLGLSISASLVRMMGGHIWVESEPGHGSTFCFQVRLPLAKEVPAEPTTCDVLASATSALRILLVEDNPANQKFASYILRERGHTVEIAGDGHQAVRMTEKSAYDVILMDVQMPGMDGLEATKAIRIREAGRRRVPIIAMTAHAMRGDRERCLAAGMDAYLSKPVNAQEMFGVVESLATGVEPVREVAATLSPAETSSEIAATVFNPEAAISRCFNSTEMVREMTQCFLQEMDALFPKMRAALEKGDLVEVGRLGHRMKGTIVHLGAQQAEEAVRRVERFCTSSDGTPSEAEQAINGLERECILLKAALCRHPLAADLT